MPKLKAPENSTSCSFGGYEYAVEKDGLVCVPDEAVADLLSHGFTIPPASLSQEELDAIAARNAAQKEIDDAAAKALQDAADEEKRLADEAAKKLADEEAAKTSKGKK